MDDPADPSLWSNLTERLHRIEEGVVSAKEREKRRGKLFSKIKYHVKRVLEKPGDDHRPDWETVVQATDQLLEEGLPHSNAELRDLLLPALGDLPENLETSKGFQIVLREIDRYLDSRPAEEEQITEEQEAEEVRRVTDLLGGRSLVLIGGIKRPRAAEALTEALGN
jgi:hypothetical protein